MDAGLVLPEGWGEGLLQGNHEPVKMFKDQERDSVLDPLDHHRIIHQSGGYRFCGNKDRRKELAVPVANQNADLAGTMEDLSGKLNGIAGSKESGVLSEENGKKPLTGMQYYAAAMGSCSFSSTRQWAPKQSFRSGIPIHWQGS